MSPRILLAIVFICLLPLNSAFGFHETFKSCDRFESEFRGEIWKVEDYDHSCTLFVWVEDEYGYYGEDSECPLKLNEFKKNGITIAKQPHGPPYCGFRPGQPLSGIAVKMGEKIYYDPY